MSLSKNALLTTACILLSWMASGQVTSIKGFVKEAETGEAVAYAVVKNSDATIGARANIDGYFLLKDIPGNSITLRIKATGYEALDTTIKLDGGIQTLNILLSRIYTQSKEVVVSAKKSERTKEVNAGVTKISSKDINSIPSVGGEPDLAQYLQLTPGVVNSGDQGGQLFIRGGSPVQNKILLDGMTIYNPFHSIGLYSVFETDLIRTSDVITGAFGAEFGNRTSAIVDVKTKDGNKSKFTGRVSASPIMARISLEGPLQKVAEGELANTTFVFSTKYSYLDRTSKSLYGGLSGIDPEVGLPYSFSDVFGKVTFASDGGSKFSVFGFNFTDKNDFPDIPSFHWNSAGGGVNFIISPSSSSMYTSGKVTYSNYTIESNEGAEVPRYSSIGGFEADLDFTYFLKNFSSIKYGVELEGFSTDYRYRNNYGTSSDETQFTTQAGGFITFHKNFNEKFIIEPGFRLMYYSSLNEASPEPRIGLKYNITDNIRFRAAAGLYSQNLISTKSDQDIVNYFTGFISGPESTIRDFTGTKSKTNIQKSQQIIAGVEFEIKNIEFTVEPWLKNFNPLININRLRKTLNDPTYMIEKGNAQGLDFSFKYIHNQLRLQGTFSMMKLSRSFKQEDGTEQSYAPPFDRRQNINFAGMYNFGNKNSWSISTRFTYGSALPFTQTQAFYQQFDIVDGGASTDFLTGNGNLGTVYSSQLNGGRLSDYARLDFGIEKKFIWAKNKILTLDFSIANILNRNNIFYIDRATYETVYQLPFLPSFTTSFNF